jgi:hypothetical protein
LNLGAAGVSAEMLLRDATRPPDRPRNGERAHERSPGRQPGAVRDGLLLASKSIRCCRKTLEKIIGCRNLCDHSVVFRLHDAIYEPSGGAEALLAFDSIGARSDPWYNQWQKWQRQ